MQIKITQNQWIGNIITKQKAEANAVTFQYWGNSWVNDVNSNIAKSPVWQELKYNKEEACEVLHN